MSDFIHIAGWTQHAHSTSPPSLQHIRSFSPSSKARAIPRTSGPNRSGPLPALPTMATVASVPEIPATRRASPPVDEEGDMSTIPDPRSRTMSPINESNPPSPLHHPDLSTEVASLSNKLINAINHQTNLDDSLSATRHELETARQRMQQLERENLEYKNSVSRGLLIPKPTVDREKSTLLSSLAEEKKKREEVEKEKKGIEQELEKLATELFEEANKMVITAREEAQREHDLVQKRNDQLKSQVVDTESLLRSHQEQLAELKQVMEQMTQQQDEQTSYTAPSTPGMAKPDGFGGISNSAGSFGGGPSEPMSPSYPTSFTHLLHPVLRTDLSAYDDFTSLLRMSKTAGAGSRISSGSYNGIALGLGLGSYPSHTLITAAQGPSNTSSTSLSANTAHPATSPVTPATPASSSSTMSATSANPLPPLKETKFYKRALAEDIEPTLRLESAPGLSWLARRTVLNAICDGNLVVEPMPPSRHYHIFACSLCGELRKDTAHTRTHRFRTSENENAQRYPLCKYCLGRVRSTCDFMGFLRILRDGLWRAPDEDAERAAWEESVRLREQMFWSRIGGGVVPATCDAARDTSRSPRVSQDERKEQEQKLAEELELTGEIHPKDVTSTHDLSPAGANVLLANSLDAANNSRSEVVSVSVSGQDELLNPHSAAAEVIQIPTVARAEKQGSQDIDPSALPDRAKNARDSVQSTSSLAVASPPEEVENPRRLSLSIPGTFE